MTFGVIGKENPFLAEMIALACESVGHDCLVLKDLAHVTRILHAFRVDMLVLDIQRPGVNGLDWLEIMAPSWPDLPSRTLLLASAELTPGEEARVKRLGADVVAKPSSFQDIALAVMERLEKARPDQLPRYGRTTRIFPSGPSAT
jgi:DNA-binding response OmpR family regulator